MNPSCFFTKIFVFVISGLMIVLFHPDPATNRNSAILVVQFSDGTATQEFTGDLAVLAFFPDRIAFSATTWEVPWHVRVCVRVPRCPGVSPNAGLPFRGQQSVRKVQGHQNETPSTPEKGLFRGQFL